MSNFKLGLTIQYSIFNTDSQAHRRNPLLYCIAPQRVQIFFISLPCGKGHSFFDIHFDTNTRKAVLSAYFIAIAVLEAQDINASILKQPESALLAAANPDFLIILQCTEGLQENQSYST